MKVQITIKVTPESREEMIATFGAAYREFREYVEKLQAEGVIPPGNIRWLLESGRWE